MRSEHSAREIQTNSVLIQPLLLVSCEINLISDFVFNRKSNMLHRSLFLLTVFAGCHGAIEFGNYLKVCNRNSVDVNDCLVEAVQEGLETMAGGISDLDLPPLDPYVQKELKLDYKNNQISAKMHLKNINVIGLKNAKVHDARLKADDDKLHLEIDLTAPTVRVTGKYEGSGQYNSLKIDAVGEFDTSMTDLVFTWKLDGTAEKNGNDTFIRIETFYMRPDLANMVTRLSNINSDSKDLIELGVRLINENWRPLYRELLPYAQMNWNRIGIRVANKIFQKVPYEQVFPN